MKLRRTRTHHQSESFTKMNVSRRDWRQFKDFYGFMDMYWACRTRFTEALRLLQSTTFTDWWRTEWTRWDFLLLTLYKPAFRHCNFKTYSDARRRSFAFPSSSRRVAGVPSISCENGSWCSIWVQAYARFPITNCSFLNRNCMQTTAVLPGKGKPTITLIRIQKLKIKLNPANDKNS